MGFPKKEGAGQKEVNFLWEKIKWVKVFFLLLSFSFLHFVTCMVRASQGHVPLPLKGHTGQHRVQGKESTE